MAQPRLLNDWRRRPCPAQAPPKQKTADLDAAEFPRSWDLAVRFLVVRNLAWQRAGGPPPPPPPAGKGTWRRPMIRHRRTSHRITPHGWGWPIHLVQSKKTTRWSRSRPTNSLTSPDALTWKTLGVAICRFTCLHCILHAGQAGDGSLAYVQAATSPGSQTSSRLSCSCNWEFVYAADWSVQCMNLPWICLIRVICCWMQIRCSALDLYF